METGITFVKVSYTLVEAVVATGISERTIRDAIDDGLLVANYCGLKSSKPVLRAIQLDAWIASLPTVRGGLKKSA